MRTKPCLTMVIAMCALALTACGDDAPRPSGLPKPPKDQVKSTAAPTGNIAYQPPILPIQISIDSNFKITISAAAGIHTPLGDVEISGGVAYKQDSNEPLPERPADVTQLIICRRSSDGQECKAYQIDRGRKLRISMNGRFVQDVERNRIVLYADPGATIEITDDGPPTELRAHDRARVDVEEFYFHEFSKETEVDLEISQSGITADLSYDHITGELKPINGAQISRVKKYGSKGGYDLPSEWDCMQEKGWKDSFSRDDLDPDKNVLACIKTAEADLGYVVIGIDGDKKPTAYLFYSWIWVR